MIKDRIAMLTHTQARPRLLDQGQAVELDLVGGAHRFHAMWLRDNAQDAATRSPGNGQRLITLLDIPSDTRIASAEWVDDCLKVRFAPEDKVVEFAADWLQAHCYDRRGACEAGWTSGIVTRWDADLAGTLVVAHYDAVRDDPAARLNWLRTIRRRGFARMTGVPALDGAPAAIAALFGYVRETNYGRIFDVRAEVNPSNLAYTNLGLQAHTDNPYRDPVPGYILLHCLENDADGGDSTLVDGYHAAAILRRDNPEAFETLATTDVTFRYHDETAFLEHHCPLIECNAAGDVMQIRYSNRTEMVGRLPVERLERYYAARAHFWNLIAPSSPLTLRFRLQPGELLMMDNYRLLHGRTGYTLATGSRHMRQCYLDRDAVGSRRRLLQPA